MKKVYSKIQYYNSRFYGICLYKREKNTQISHAEYLPLRKENVILKNFYFVTKNIIEFCK